MATNGDDVSGNGASKRLCVAASSTGHGDDDYDGGDSDDYGALDEETVDYASGEEYYFDDCNGDEETGVTNVVDDCDRTKKERVVAVLTEDDVRRRQEEPRR